ncbi:FadR/GntR family transcriptional regulator [Natronoglycomyces albus]|uniref:FadR family transcriptional regulator n=1 Tax=Natronoglycomyces albus TaxID=2811108 RepID=A0A895XGJ6_9ACTN|nr:FadR/GntR family transcriptional regulator [Natronoglycomyces albus]QSB04981.1 FadR family transcriptional regulator [Natronoglycomyces albus]
MALRSARKSALVDQVIEQLRAQISSGEWPMGSKIPTEAQLVEQLGVGRNTVREGVRALAHAGLLQIRQGAGTFVVGNSEVAGAMRRRVARGRSGEAMEVRRGLEIESSRLAAMRRTDEDIVELRKYLDMREDAWKRKDRAAFIAADLHLHQAVAAASHNKLLHDLYLHLGDAIGDSVEAALGERMEEVPHLDHTGLVQAIIDGDPVAAANEASGYLHELMGDN